jgi:hypothetical protein
MVENIDHGNLSSYVVWLRREKCTGVQPMAHDKSRS